MLDWLRDAYHWFTPDRLWHLQQIVAIAQPIILALLTLFAGIIAYWQMKIAKEKVRYDLYDRRYQKYEEAAKLVGTFSDFGRKQKSVDHLMVLIGCKNALIDKQFLFSKSICKLIDRIAERANDTGKLYLKAETERREHGESSPTTEATIKNHHAELQNMMALLTKRLAWISHTG